MMTAPTLQEFNNTLTQLANVIRDATDAVAKQMASVQTFFNSWCSVDPGLKDVADQFRAQWLKGDRFRFTAVGESLMAMLRCDVDGSISKALGLFAHADKVRPGGEYAPLPASAGPYKGQCPHAACCLWYGARGPIYSLTEAATDAQRAISSTICKMSAVTKTMESEAARTKLQDMYELWREQYLALEWPDTKDISDKDVEDARARMDLCILRMGTAHESPDAAAKWLSLQLPQSAFVHGRSEAHITDALARAEGVPARGVTEFKAQLRDCLKAVAEDARQHLVPQMARIRGVAAEWVRQYPWLKPMADYAMADLDEQVRLRFQSIKELTTVIDEDAEAAYRDQNKAMVAVIKARDADIRKGMPVDYFGATLKPQGLPEDQARVAVAFNCALVSEVETLGCMLVENGIAMRAVAGVFGGLIRSRRVPADCYEFWRKSVGSWFDSVSLALLGAAPTPVSSKDVATVSRCIDECKRMGIGDDMPWGEIVGQCLKAMAVNEHVTPQKLAESMSVLMDVGTPDNPAAALVKCMESALTPEILHGLAVCAEFGNCHDPSRSDSGLDDLLWAALRDAAESKLVES